MAAVLGLEEAGGTGTPPPSRAERLASFVPDKAMLLVLDNCEHLVEACAGLARRLLEAGPRLRVLATSREVLGVPGEVVWPIPPLAVPAAADDTDAGTAADAGQAAAPEALAGFDAVRLFVERAASADPGFVLDAASAPVVAELCRRLDGLPLAIELAAARTRALPPAELAARLEDRFRLLAGGARALDPRQQTLRATVDWSWDLLEERDRRLLRRLSVFSGGWTVAAAEAVCGGDGLEGAEVLDGLFRLVDRSLIVAAGRRRPGPVHHAGDAAGLRGRAAGRGRRARDAGRPPHRLVPGAGRAGRRPPHGPALAAAGRRRLRQPAGGAGPDGGRPRGGDRAAPGRRPGLVLVDDPHHRGPPADGRCARPGRRAAADPPPGQGAPGVGDAARCR